MLLVKYKNINVEDFINKYNDNVAMLVPDKSANKDWLITFIKQIKSLEKDDNVIIVDYMKELILSFKALKMTYSVIYPKKLLQAEYAENKEEYDTLRLQAQEVTAYVLDDNNNIEKLLEPMFNWLSIPVETTLNDKPAIIEERKPLTFKNLVEDDTLEITDNDIRDMKALTNRFKITMLLQAKSRLKVVLKLCDILDKLYDELINRIDLSLATTDTASLMYTADYIAKALNDTNQFIMPLINNEKLQNFFIIDNSSVVNINNDSIDINKREKIRKAAEIVLDNIDYFASGEYNNIVNPNVEVENERRMINMIQQPSQYDCDNMQVGDKIFVKDVSPIYKFIRKYFLKDKPVIRVRSIWGKEDNDTYVTCYQEDCTLLYAFEVACVQVLENQVPCVITSSNKVLPEKVVMLPEVMIGLYNIVISMENQKLTIPTSFIQHAIDKNQDILNAYDDTRKIQEAIKYQKFKGDYFKKYAKEHNIQTWQPIYCSICGKPLVFNFNSDNIEITNQCDCGALNFKLTNITYDEFALWYTNQIISKPIIDRYNSVWFKKED